MYYFINDSLDPFFNLATEEYLLKNYDDNFFMLYRNQPALIVGKHQNTLAEINLEKTTSEMIPVIRRLSGGGTVFHDLGNLNYCFIKKGEKGKLVDFKKYSQPIVDALQNLNINARFEGKSDLTIDGKKFSGNASHVFKNKIMQHGTMLFCSDLKRLNQLLKVNPLKFKDRGVRSIRSRVTNISEYLNSSLSLEQFGNLILEKVKQEFPNATRFSLSDKDRQQIELLVENKYKTTEWNYGYSPNYSFEKTSYLKEGKILEIKLAIEKGIIKNISVNGNCILSESGKEFENKLKGIKHTQNNVKELIKSININLYFNNISENELLSAFF